MTDGEPHRERLVTSIIAHKGELIVSYSTAVQSVFLAPQAARDLAQALINAAEQAEQQMDAEQKP